MQKRSLTASGTPASGERGGPAADRVAPIGDPREAVELVRAGASGVRVEQLAESKLPAREGAAAAAAAVRSSSGAPDRSCARTLSWWGARSRLRRGTEEALAADGGGAARAPPRGAATRAARRGAGDRSPRRHAWWAGRRRGRSSPILATWSSTAESSRAIGSISSSASCRRARRATWRTSSRSIMTAHSRESSQRGPSPAPVSAHGVGRAPGV